MNSNLTIGQLAKETGLTTKTIRFYEEIGLIKPVERADNGYRSYPANMVEELNIIKTVRDLGLPIPEIKKLMIGCDEGGCEHNQEYLAKEIKNYVEILKEKISQLNKLKSKLENLKVAICDCDSKDECTYCCNVLGQIAQSTKGGEDKWSNKILVVVVERVIVVEAVAANCNTRKCRAC